MPDAPKRIQRRRTKGWRLPGNAAIVTRPTEWGNPWRISIGTVENGERRGQRVYFVDRGEGSPSTRIFYDHGEAVKAAVELFRSWAGLPAQARWRARARLALKGKLLACTCPLDQPCHADVLLEIANAEPPRV